MKTKVSKHIKAKSLCRSNTEIICAVSGGIDSMAMVHCLKDLGYRIHIAHVNHGLREAESEQEERLVQNYADSHNIGFLYSKLDIPKNTQKGESVQMSCRRLRYEFFDSLLKKYPNALLATAHHQDDAAESLLMAMIKGSGLRGLQTIPVKRGRYIRPLLSVNRSDILKYAKAEKISYLEDSSNQDPKYLRNRIRHELVPLFKELSGGGSAPLYRFTKLVDKLSCSQVKQMPFGCMENEQMTWWRNETLTQNAIVCSQILHDVGLHPDIHEEVIRSLRTKESGKTFNLYHGELRLERDKLVHFLPKSPSNQHFYGEDLNHIGCPNLAIEELNVEAFSGSPERHQAWLDRDKLKGDFELRPWRQGDRMKPWGMEGTKLISDLLSEAKVNSIEKQDTLVLTLNEEIIWLVGHRIAQGFGIEADTTSIIKLTWNPDINLQESNESTNGLETRGANSRNFEEQST